jgi:hypothetical protein
VRLCQPAPSAFLLKPSTTLASSIEESSHWQLQFNELGG